MGFPFYVVIIVAIVIAGLAVIVGVTDNRHTVGVLFASYIIASGEAEDIVPRDI